MRDGGVVCRNGVERMGLEKKTKLLQRRSCTCDDNILQGHQEPNLCEQSRQCAVHARRD